MNFKPFRLIEIDALRGVAITAMVVFHGAIDWQLLTGWEFQAYVWPWIVPVRMVQWLFLGLVGVSIALSRRTFMEQVQRGAMVFWFGMWVSLATAIVYPEWYVRFGVLHCIGVCIPLVRIFKGRPLAALLMAGAAWAVSVVLPLEPLPALDYFPVLPWVAAPLVGLAVGEWFYGRGEPTPLKVLGAVPGLAAMGRHSLVIYLLHQPILYFTLWGLKILINE